MTTLKILVIALVVQLAGTVIQAQVTVSGPACVTAGLSYQYKIIGTWSNTSTMQVCANGGVITNSGNPCTSSGAPQSTVNITWGASASTRTLSVVSSSGNASMNVNVAPIFQPGKIDSVIAIQSIAYNSIPATITCSLAAGGNCSPTYTYSWEQSDNGLHWNSIAGANGQNISFTIALIQSTYYRRKVIETASGVISYSNMATVFVGPDMTGHN